MMGALVTNLPALSKTHHHHHRNWRTCANRNRQASISIAAAETSLAIDVEYVHYRVVGTPNGPPETGDAIRQPSDPSNFQGEISEAAWVAVVDTQGTCLLNTYLLPEGLQQWRCDSRRHEDETSSSSYRSSIHSSSNISGNNNGRQRRHDSDNSGSQFQGHTSGNDKPKECFPGVQYLGGVALEHLTSAPPVHEVVGQLKQLTNDRPRGLLVGHGLKKDVLALCWSDAPPTYDLLTFSAFQRKSGSAHQLRQLAREHLGLELHSPGVKHDAEQDARVAMALFQKVVIPSLLATHDELVAWHTASLLREIALRKAMMRQTWEESEK